MAGFLPLLVLFAAVLIETAIAAALESGAKAGEVKPK